MAEFLVPGGKPFESLYILAIIPYFGNDETPPVYLSVPTETREGAMVAAKSACAMYPEHDIFICSIKPEYHARLGDMDFKPL